MLLTRQQLEERLVALHRASLELVKDVSLETLLERIPQWPWSRWTLATQLWG